MKKLLLTLLSLTGSVSLFAADSTFSGLTDLGNNLAGTDLFAVTDTSDTTQSASGTTKKISTTNVGAFLNSDTAYSSAFNGVTTIAPSKNTIYDQLHIGDADDDGKIDVLDLAVAGFPALNSSGALVAARSVAEGAAIDVTNGDGASGNPTVAWDATEAEALTWGAGGNASNVWTFNLSGTDPVVTFSSGIVNVSTGTLQQGGVDVVTTSGTQVFTNKTLDGAGTGNVLKFKSLPQFTSPLRVDGTGCTIGTTSTTLGYGLGTFSNSTDQASNWMEFRIIVPQDWDTAVDPTIKIADLIGADTSTRRYVASVLSVASSASATGAPSTAINIDFSADGSGASGDVEVSATTTLTGWGAAVTPGQLMIIRIARDGDASQDASTVGSTVLSAELAYGASQ